MKQLVLIGFLLIIFQICFAQISKNVTRQELENKGFEISNKIYNYPLNELPNDSVFAYLGTLYEEDGYFVCLLFSGNDNLFKRSKIIRLPDENVYRCKRPGAFYQDSCIVTECQWMKGITCGEKYKVKKGELIFIESFMYDLNEGVYRAAEIAKKEDDPISYCEAYLGAQYYSDLEYRVKESLEWAYKNSLQFYKNKDYQNAASIMHGLEQRCVMSTEIYDFMGDDFIKIWSDVTLFYLKAGMNEQCIGLSKRLTEIKSGLVGVYLQYGDALYNLHKIEEAKYIYKTYIDLMTKNNNKDKIPTRITDRYKE